MGQAAALAAPGHRWHLIGHLQRNKIRRTLPTVHCIQSVDSLRLLAALEAEAAAAGRDVLALLEVNISADATKHGFAPAEAAAALDAASRCPHVRVQGLMGMAALEGGLPVAERDFAALRNLRDRLAPQSPAGVNLAELSMGMSGDFEAAIRHGATQVRVGSALFEGVAGDAPE